MWCVWREQNARFWRLWDWFDELEEKDVTKDVYVERKISAYAWVFFFWIYR